MNPSKLIAGPSMEIDLSTGNIRRRDLNLGFSGQWRCTGAFLLNNFGNVVRRLTLQQLAEQIRTDKQSLWFKNGKPKFRLCDFDHGTARVQWNPPLRQGEVWLTEEVSQ